MTDVIPLERLAITLVPVVIVLIILYTWSIGVKTSLMAIIRMVAQLLILGYLLRFIFEADNSLVIIGVLSVMLLGTSWISLRVAAKHRRRLLSSSFLSIVTSGGITLFVVTQGVLSLDPWYEPRKMIPLAGMIFSSCMNAVSLAVERYFAETDRGADMHRARQTALEAALIPITNSLFAVGLVSIPGMMTGQVLAGIAPAVAARYQIMVMCMIFGSAGLSASLCLHLVSRRIPTHNASVDHVGVLDTPLDESQ